MVARRASFARNSASLAHYDVAVVGGGVVGAAFALALSRQGLSVAVVEAKVPETAIAADPDSWDQRVYAISPSSLNFLNTFGVGPQLDATRVCPIYAMEIFGDAVQAGLDAQAKLKFSAYAAGLPELACIVEHRQLHGVLWRMLRQAPGVTLFANQCGGQCGEALTLNAKEAVLQLADDTCLHANLIVGADGAQSWVRGKAGLKAETIPYDHLGIVANFHTTLAHRHIARQWFRNDGILAYLPLPGNRLSIVWSAPAPYANTLMAMTAEDFSATVAAAGQQACGTLELIGRPAAYPLQLLRSERLVGTRCALIGDAGHVVHPLAGQGLNLGLQDAEMLLAVLAGRGPMRDCGNAMLLRQYERRRREAILSMEIATDGLKKLFARPEKWASLLRNHGMGFVDALPFLKKQLIRHAVGR